jgi:Lipid A 3-O-deacylase (PagL)
MMAAARGASAGETATSEASVFFSLAAAAAAEAQNGATTEIQPQAVFRYAQEGSHWGGVGFGITPSVEADSFGVNGTFSYTYFLVDGVEITGEAGAWFYSQDGDDAIAINPCAVLRWHFWQSEDFKTTAYIDGGIGVLFSNDNIPYDGTSFNFTPRFGVGFTRQLTDSGWRLQGGLRWNHVSNARITGDLDNPSRDGPMLYFGVLFPF